MNSFDSYANAAANIPDSALLVAAADQIQLVEKLSLNLRMEIRSFLDMQMELRRRGLSGPNTQRIESIGFVALVDSGLDMKIMRMALGDEGPNAHGKN